MLYGSEISQIRTGKRDETHMTEQQIVRLKKIKIVRLMIEAYLTPDHQPPRHHIPIVGGPLIPLIVAPIPHLIFSSI